MREIIDFHLHPFLESSCSIAKYGTPGTAEEFVSHLKELGIGLCAGSVIRRGEYKEFGEVRYLNEQALRFRDRFPGFYVPGMHVHSRFPEESCQEMERMHAEGVNLIGELVWYLMDYPCYSSEAFRPVWELAQKLDMTLSIHPSSVEDMEQLVTDFPHLRVVIAHPGEQADYQKKLEIMRNHGNAYLDICGTGLFRYGMLQHGVKELGSRRFLFGTDFPVCSAGMQIGGVEAEVLTEEEKEDIYSRNARRLLKL